MEQFLLLGQVPGTKIVISFASWLLVFTIIGGLVGLLVVYRRRHQAREFFSKQHPKVLDHIAR